MLLTMAAPKKLPSQKKQGWKNTCRFLGCSSDKRKGDCMMYTYPADEEYQALWDAFVLLSGRERPAKCGRLCGLHFREDQYDFRSFQMFQFGLAKKLVLKKTAVPTIIPNENMKKIKSSWKDSEEKQKWKKTLEELETKANQNKDVTNLLEEALPDNWQTTSSSKQLTASPDTMQHATPLIVTVKEEIPDPGYEEDASVQNMGCLSVGEFCHPFSTSPEEFQQQNIKPPPASSTPLNRQLQSPQGIGFMKTLSTLHQQVQSSQQAIQLKVKQSPDRGGLTISQVPYSRFTIVQVPSQPPDLKSQIQYMDSRLFKHKGVSKKSKHRADAKTKGVSHRAKHRSKASAKGRGVPAAISRQQCSESGLLARGEKGKGGASYISEQDDGSLLGMSNLERRAEQGDNEENALGMSEETEEAVRGPLRNDWELSSESLYTDLAQHALMDHSYHRKRKDEEGNKVNQVENPAKQTEMVSDADTTIAVREEIPDERGEKDEEKAEEEEEEEEEEEDFDEVGRDDKRDLDYDPFQSRKKKNNMDTEQGKKESISTSSDVTDIDSEDEDEDEAARKRRMRLKYRVTGDALKKKILGRRMQLPKRFKCQICTQFFSTIQDFSEHWHEYHGDRAQYFSKDLNAVLGRCKQAFLERFLEKRQQELVQQRRAQRKEMRLNKPKRVRDSCNSKQKMEENPLVLTLDADGPRRSIRVRIRKARREMDGIPVVNEVEIETEEVESSPSHDDKLQGQEANDADDAKKRLARGESCSSKEQGRGCLGDRRASDGNGPSQVPVEGRGQDVELDHDHRLSSDSMDNRPGNPDGEESDRTARCDGRMETVGDKEGSDEKAETAKSTNSQEITPDVERKDSDRPATCDGRMEDGGGVSLGSVVEEDWKETVGDKEESEEKAETSKSTNSQDITPGVERKDSHRPATCDGRLEDVGGVSLGSVVEEDWKETVGDKEESDEKAETAKSTNSQDITPGVERVDKKRDAISIGMEEDESNNFKGTESGESQFATHSRSKDWVYLTDVGGSNVGVDGNLVSTEENENDTSKEIQDTTNSSCSSPRTSIDASRIGDGVDVNLDRLERDDKKVSKERQDIADSSCSGHITATDVVRIEEDVDVKLVGAVDIDADEDQINVSSSKENVDAPCSNERTENIERNSTEESDGSEKNDISVSNSSSCRLTADDIGEDCDRVSANKPDKLLMNDLKDLDAATLGFVPEREVDVLFEMIGWSQVELECPVCQNYVGYMSYERHLTHHKRKFRCNQCCKWWVTESQFRIHESKCTGKPQAPLGVCEYCGKISKSMRNHHRYVHGISAKMHPCEVCGSEFKSRASLFRHAECHKEVRKFVCEVCGRGFTQSGNLKSHMRQHSNEKPFQCVICEEAFTHNVSLKAHAKRYHGIDMRCGLQPSATGRRKRVNESTSQDIAPKKRGRKRESDSQDVAPKKRGRKKNK